jgi:hypothetical protein
LVNNSTCPKHVELFIKINLRNSASLCLFFIRMFHDALSSECQMLAAMFTVLLYRILMLSPICVAKVSTSANL